MINQKAACAYTLHESGIHEFVFNEATRTGIDEYMVINDEIAFSTPKDATILLLLDISQSGVPPLAYFISKVRKARNKYPHQIKTQVALIYTDSRVISLIDNVIRLMLDREGNARFFKSEQRDDAFAWLLSGE